MLRQLNSLSSGHPNAPLLTLAITFLPLVVACGGSAENPLQPVAPEPPPTVVTSHVVEPGLVTLEPTQSATLSVRLSWSAGPGQTPNVSWSTPDTSLLDIVPTAGGQVRVTAKRAGRTFVTALVAGRNASSSVIIDPIPIVRFSPGLLIAGSGAPFVGGPVNPEIFLLSSGDTAARNLTTNPAVDGGPELSPDGDRFLFMSNRDDSNIRQSVSTNWTLYAMPSGGGIPTRLVALGTSVLHPIQYRWAAPNRIHLIRGGSFQPPAGQESTEGLYTLNSDGTGLQRLASFDAISQGLPASLRPTAVTLSPDGSRLAFITADGRLWLAPFSSTPRPVAVTSPCVFPSSCNAFSFSPDGQRIAMVRDGGVWLINLATLGTTRAADHQSPPSGLPAPLSWSGDGRYVSYVSGLRLEVLDTQSLAVSTLSSDSQSRVLAWSREGTLLAADFFARDGALYRSPFYLVLRTESRAWGYSEVLQPPAKISFVSALVFLPKR